MVIPTCQSRYHNKSRDTLYRTIPYKWKIWYIEPLCLLKRQQIYENLHIIPGKFEEDIQTTYFHKWQKLLFQLFHTKINVTIFLSLLNKKAIYSYKYGCCIGMTTNYSTFCYIPLRLAPRFLQTLLILKLL